MNDNEPLLKRINDAYYLALEHPNPGTVRALSEAYLDYLEVITEIKPKGREPTRQDETLSPARPPDDPRSGQP